VRVLEHGKPVAHEQVTKLIRNLVRDPDNRYAVARAGSVPQLVRQLECGSPLSNEMAASALNLIARKSADHRATVTNELVKLLASTKEEVRQRASEALRDMGSNDNPPPFDDNAIMKKTITPPEPLVHLLKDGLRDDRVEAQEYALLSLSAISDAPSIEGIAQSGGIEPLIAALRRGQLSSIAQEHAAMVLSALAPGGDNAKTMHECQGVHPLVRLLSAGTMNAKKHAALILAQLARRADAVEEIAATGGVSALASWLANPSEGPAETAAIALSEIALDSPDTQVQLAEEGAISPLIEMVRAWMNMSSGSPSTHVVSRTSPISIALRLATAAVGVLATLAKDNAVNQTTISEEEGIPPLIELLQETDERPQEKASKTLWHLAQTEDNQTSIGTLGGIDPLVDLLTRGNDLTRQYSAAAVEALARNHLENQLAFGKAGAIDPLVVLLGSESRETRNHAVGALHHLASHNEVSRRSVVAQLVVVLHSRNAAAQMKSAEALVSLASRSSDTRKAIAAANAIEPLIHLLGDGRRVKSDTPQERAAAVVAELARSGENKVKIVAAGGAPPLVAMVSSESPKAQTHAAAALWQLATAESNKSVIANIGGIAPLVGLLENGPIEAKKHAMAALWHLASVGENKATMVEAGAIPLLVSLLCSELDEAREYAAAVVSALARTNGSNKKGVAQARGIEPLITLLCDASIITQKHAACTLWSLADAEEGVYIKEMAELGVVEPLINMLLLNHPDTRGFAAACLLSLCADMSARRAIIEARGADPLLELLRSPNTWLRTQAAEMLKLLGIPFLMPDAASPRVVSPRPGSPRAGGARPGSPGRDGDGTQRQPQFKVHKMLPIRKDKEIDVDKDNPKLGELQKGDIVFILERREVAEGTWRALVTLEANGVPAGWVTSRRDGMDFLISDDGWNSNGALLEKQRFHFWPHQVNQQMGTTYSHFS
jgi:hypothetical protein